MMIRARCSKCQGQIDYSDDEAGTTIQCPHCRQEVILPPPLGDSQKPQEPDVYLWMIRKTTCYRRTRTFFGWYLIVGLALSAAIALFESVVSGIILAVGVIMAWQLFCLLTDAVDVLIDLARRR